MSSYTVAVVVLTTISNVSGWTGELGLSVVLTKFGGCAARNCGYDCARDRVGGLRVRRGDSGHRRDAGCSGWGYSCRSLFCNVASAPPGREKDGEKRGPTLRVVAGGCRRSCGCPEACYLAINGCPDCRRGDNHGWALHIVRHGPSRTIASGGDRPGNGDEGLGQHESSQDSWEVVSSIGSKPRGYGSHTLGPGCACVPDHNRRRGLWGVSKPVDGVLASDGGRYIP